MLPAALVSSCCSASLDQIGVVFAAGSASCSRLGCAIELAEPGVSLPVALAIDRSPSWFGVVKQARARACGVRFRQVALFGGPHKKNMRNSLEQQQEQAVFHFFPFLSGAQKNASQRKRGAEKKEGKSGKEQQARA